MPKPPDLSQRRLDELRDMRRTLNAQEKQACRHDKPAALFRHITTTGAVFVYKGCPACRARMEPGWVSQVGQAVDTFPVGEDHHYDNPPCQVCGEFGTEVHHWAPKEMFGPLEADKWPTAWLCRACHAEWHDRIRKHQPGTLF